MFNKIISAKTNLSHHNNTQFSCARKWFPAFSTALICFLGTTFLPVASISEAEVIRVPIGQQAKPHSLPAKGMHKDTVLSRFGAPASKSTPVGYPPISKWHYPGYTVYFEYSRVIHSVSHSNKTSSSSHGPNPTVRGFVSINKKEPASESTSLDNDSAQSREENNIPPGITDANN